MRTKEDLGFLYEREVKDAMNTLWLYASQQKEYNDDTLKEVHQAIDQIEDLWNQYRYMIDKCTRIDHSYGNRLLYSKHLERALEFMCKKFAGFAVPTADGRAKAGSADEWKAYAMKETEDKELDYKEEE